MKSLLGFFLLPALFWSEFVLNCRNIEYAFLHLLSLSAQYTDFKLATNALKYFLFVQTLVNEVNGYGEKRTTMESTARRLIELSRKEDCDVIHNLIMTVQDRHKKLQQRASERGRTLEEVKKSAKQVCVQIHQLQYGGGGLTSVFLQTFCLISVFISHA